jgi:hypothetical protein
VFLGTLFPFGKQSEVLRSPQIIRIHDPESDEACPNRSPDPF